MQLAVVTATVASEGVEVGDVTVLISDSLQDQLNNIVKEAAAACGAPAKIRKRDGESQLGCIVHEKNSVANRLLFPRIRGMHDQGHARSRTRRRGSCPH